MMYVRTTYPSCFENMLAGSIEAGNNELFGKDLSGIIFCTLMAVGLTMGGRTLIGMRTIGVGP
jgi:hypothetical protein